jgi:hypothetical protein
MIAILVAALLMAPDSATTRAPCMAGMKALLIEGHFSGPILCSHRDATFTLAGRTSGNSFSIYDYRYRYRPSGGNVDHGGQRMVVFRGKTYVGQYDLSVPPYVSMSVHGTRVELKSADAPTDVSLDFSRGPPDKILINGMEAAFFR